ncbi:MAG: RnfABCDGE type electron transport complex subunit B, partial [Betaproteobacteria bacterium]
CIEACPVDAIVGARGLMHTVVEPWCIGCKMCLPPCPVDCIAMAPRAGRWTATLKREAGERARQRRRRQKSREIRPSGKDRKAVLAKVLGR